TVPWGTFFQNEISSAFDSMLSIEPQLTTMLDSILPKFQDLGLGDFQKSILRRQIKSLTRSFKDKCAWIVHKIQLRQKEINRMFEKIVQDEMSGTYGIAAKFYGRGTWIRMRTAMHENVGDKKTFIFQKTVSTVQQELVDLHGFIEKKLRRRIEKTIEALQADLAMMGALPRHDGIERDYGKIERPVVKFQVAKILKVSDDEFKKMSEEEDISVESASENFEENSEDEAD